MFKNIQTEKGFTLVEIIVSLAIFTIVAVVAVGAFLKVIDANQKSQTLKTAINNVNFALESMSRELRTGMNFTCINGATISLPGTLPSPGVSCESGDIIAFNSYHLANDPGNNNLAYAYAFVTEADGRITIKKAEHTNADYTSNITLDEFVPVISPTVFIDTYSLKVVANTISNRVQPYVFIRIKGHTGTKEKSKTFFDVQTTVSQRDPI